ncbi:MAG: OmpA family protein [Roseobacter sp.]
MMEDPYRGLMPYQEGDADYFFGRDTERTVIASNLSAARFTLLYGPSGVGKTSALRAGVMRDLRLEAQRNLDELGLPEFAVVWLSEWRGDPVATLDAAVREGVGIAMGGDGGPVEGDTPIDRLAAWNERLNGEIFLILDQFEEYFLYHPNDGPNSFGALLPQIVTNQNLQVNVLLSLRDDALSGLDRFKGRIPDLFANYLRIDRLNRAAGQLAIEQPVLRWNQQRSETDPEITVDPELVTRVLDEVRTGRQGFGERGRGRADEATTANEEIETPFLQLVMQRIWSEERQENSNRLRYETLDRLGGAGEILRTHLGRVLDTLPEDERKIAQSVFYYLVTPSGAKIAHSAEDLASYSDNDADLIEKVLKRLCERQSRILRVVAASDETAGNRYEIYHDVLGNAILEWQRDSKIAEQTNQLLQEQANASAQRQNLIRKTARLNIAVVILGTALLVGFYTLRNAQMDTARQETQLMFEALQGTVSQSQKIYLAAAKGSGTTKPPPPPPSVANRNIIWELENAISDDIETGRLTLLTTASGTGITLSTTNLFASGEADISAEGLVSIQKIATALENTDGRILIAGHTDSVPLSARGDYKTNAELSLARAQAVAAIISANLTEAGRVFAEGRGASEPIADNTTTEGRSINRRIEITLQGVY